MTEPSILRFIGFLGTGLAFCIIGFCLLAAFGVIMTKSRQIKGRDVFLVSLASALIGCLYTSASLKILTAHGYLPFFLALVVATVVLALLAEFLWLVFGEKNVPWAARGFWMQLEFREIHPNIEKSVQIISALLLLVYPIYIGIGYFGKAFASGHWPEHALRATLVIVFGVGMLTTLPKQLYVLVSRNVMEGTRSRILISQLTGSVSLLMLLSLFVWTIDPTTENVKVFGAGLSFMPNLVFVIGAYVVLVIIVPYVVGHFRNKEWAANLSNRRAVIYSELSAGIRAPGIDTAIQTLTKARAQIDKEIEALEDDKSYRLLMEHQDGRGLEFDLKRAAATQSAQRDPRFFHNTRLSGLKRQVNDSIARLEELEEDVKKRETLSQLAEWLDHRKTEHLEEGSGKPWAMVAITAIITALVNPVLTNLGQMFASRLGFESE